MAFREKDRSLADMFDALVAGGCANETLEMISSLVDWGEIRALIAPTYSASRSGAPAIDPVILVKMLLLESLYNLSDVRVAQECADRLSFRKFLGLALSEKTPDDTTLVRFRDRLREHGLLPGIEARMTQALANRGLCVRPGSITMIDATLVRAAVNEPPRDRESGLRGEAKDPDKLHIAQDRATGLIAAHRETPASVHDSRVFEELLRGDEGAVLADKGYDNARGREFLRKTGARDLVMRRLLGTKGGYSWLAETNNRIARLRSAIEGSFAHLKRWRRCGRAVYRSLDKFRAQMTWGIIAHNLLCHRRWMRKLA